MKIVHTETLISKGSYKDSVEWSKIHSIILKKIKSVEWPAGSGKFIVYPESGKKRGEGNGVAPIKDDLINKLLKIGWKKEVSLDLATRKKPGKIDAALYTNEGIIALEWETGNISSSHRALNKMCLGLMKGAIIAGILVVPSRELYQYLTDRIGNWDELVPYIDVWKNIKCETGILEIIVIQHDKIDNTVPRIPKRTDGRALV